MKLRLIENICKRTVSLVLLTGICLLYSKGIIPVYLTSCSFCRERSSASFSGRSPSL